MVEFHEDNFEQKLLLLKDTQDSIQSLSLWCLKHQSHHKKIVSCWLHVLKKVKVEQRVTLFYLANDVIQYSKRKGYPFVESWATALQKGTPLVREDKIKHKILRLFKIWGERNIYDDTFLTDLSGLLTAHTKKSNQSTVDLIHEFQPSSLFSKIRKCKALEEDTDLKMKLMKECSIPVSDPDAVQIAIKDRRNGDDLMQDIEDGIQKLEAYTKALELEIKERIEVINVLEVSEQFYDTQRGEAKVVCNAYRNFGNRVKTLKRKLEELLPTLPSPVPSPDVNAPSPSSESDIDIPEDRSLHYDSEKSFIGTDFVNTMNNVGEMHHQSMQNTYQPTESNNINYGMHSQSNYNDYMHSGTTLVSSPAGYYRNNSQHKLDSPTHHLDDNLSYTYQHQSEGNRIEVINSNNTDSHGGYSVGGFPVAVATAPMPSLKIPGLESPTDNAREVFSFIESKVKVAEDNATPPIMWGDKPLTKYQSWPSPDITWNNSQETPVSPPAFEQESYANPAVEYVDTNPPTDEVDHCLTASRTAKKSGNFERLATIPLPKHDIDHRIAFNSRVSPNRNLISLTESPSTNDTVWKNTGDSDYRAIPMPPTPPVLLNSLDTGRMLTKAPLDNIESVDMEMSDDESDKGDERGAKHRRSSLKDDGSSPYKNRNHQQLLQPPPNPWEVVNVTNEEPDQTRNEMMSGFMEHPPLPPQFPPPCFPMSLPPDQNIRFRPPPPMMMPPPPPPQNNHSNALFHPPPPPPPLMNLQRFGQPPFRPPVPFVTPQPDVNSNRTAPETVPSENLNTIEPLFLNRPPENAPEFASKSVRSNLKQISLSDVLEKTMREADCNVDAENGDEETPLSGGIHDHLFDDDIGGTEGNENDDGDDLYNDIDVKTTDPAENGTDKNENPPESESDSKTTPTKKAPFQAIVPKLTKSPMAPPMLTDDDPRSSWPLTPVIDLSNDSNNREDDAGSEPTWPFIRIDEPRNIGFGQCGNSEFQPRMFNNNCDDRRFPTPPQNSPPNRFRGGGDVMNRGRGRFLSPRGDFRPHGGAPPPFVNQRMPFRSSNALNVRGNFQNSPRIFRGRSPGRPFRRGLRNSATSSKLNSAILLVQRSNSY